MLIYKISNNCIINTKNSNNIKEVTKQQVLLAINKLLITILKMIFTSKNNSMYLSRWWLVKPTRLKPTKNLTLEIKWLGNSNTCILKVQTQKSWAHHLIKTTIRYSCITLCWTKTRSALAKTNLCSFQTIWTMMS